MLSSNGINWYDILGASVTEDSHLNQSLINTSLLKLSLSLIPINSRGKLNLGTLFYYLLYLYEMCEKSCYNKMAGQTSLRGGAVTLIVILAFADMWHSLINDLTLTAREVAEYSNNKPPDKQPPVYMSLPRAGVSTNTH